MYNSKPSRRNIFTWGHATRFNVNKLLWDCKYCHDFMRLSLHPGSHVWQRTILHSSNPKDSLCATGWNLFCGNSGQLTVDAHILKVPAITSTQPLSTIHELKASQRKIILSANKIRYISMTGANLKFQKKRSYPRIIIPGELVITAWLSPTYFSISLIVLIWDRLPVYITVPIQTWV